MQIVVSNYRTISQLLRTHLLIVSFMQDHPNMIEEIIDFEDEERIIGYLMEPKYKLDVVSIIGMAGIGKSTLAWKIYQNKRIELEFELRFWVDASQKLNKVLLKILKSFAPTGVSNPDQEDLATTVRECLKGKKFLLVLDNVWSSQEWEEIRKVLPIANTKGKVLVTSRDEKVGAMRAIISRKPYTLDFLSPEKSWQLLQLTLFGNLESCPEELREVGGKIAIKCGGVPLIIVVIGGILRSQYMCTQSNHVRATEWNKVSENMNQISLEQDYEKTISKAIGHSYDKLPYELRGCFLSLGMFPESEEISASTLTQLWMAEGFIRPRGLESFQETTDRLLNYFIKMNLLMVEKKHLDQIRTCRVHDMIRRFCISQAEKEIVFRVMEESRGLISHPVYELTKFYRLCLHSNLNTFLSGKPKVPHVRTFMCFCKHLNHMEDMHIKGIRKAFKLLRVLSCKSISFGRFPNLTKLMLLKSITLSFDKLDVLPKQISKLLNLQTLVVETNPHSITVKANIWKMIQLRHVKTKAAMFLVDKKRKVRDGGNLKTLIKLSPESCTLYEEKLRNLTTLGVRGKLAINILYNMSREKFQNLEKLKLENEYVVNEPASNPISLHQPHHFPSNLKKVTLSKTYLLWQRHMPILAKIESLEVLKLKDNAFTGIHWPAMDDGFKHLQFLLIANTDLFAWEVSHFQS